MLHSPLEIREKSQAQSFRAYLLERETPYITIGTYENLLGDCPEALDLPLPTRVLDYLYEEFSTIRDCEIHDDRTPHLLIIRNTLLTNFLLQTRPKQTGAQTVGRLAQQTRSSMPFNPDNVLG